MLRRILAGLDHALDLARLFDLPDRHPDRMIAASYSTSAWVSSSPSRCGITGRRHTRDDLSSHHAGLGQRLEDRS